MSLDAGRQLTEIDEGSGGSMEDEGTTSDSSGGVQQLRISSIQWFIFFFFHNTKWIRRLVTHFFLSEAYCDAF